MEQLAPFIDIILHLDKYLAMLVQEYGVWIYAILFLIIFCETGLVIMPFLPGDSLLFVAGAAAAAGNMDIATLIVVLMSAAILGDNTNYWVGRWVGPRVWKWERSRFFNRDAFDKTHAYFERHGGKTLLVARFLPLLRTFAPFVAGVAAMTYKRFVALDVFGVAVWICSLTLLGYWFGNLPVVKSNLSVVILAIIGLSLLPMAIALVRSRLAARSA